MPTLIDLLPYGKPSISYITRGWHCCVDVHVTAPGSRFNIQSDFDHKTPEEAIEVCYNRIQETIKAFTNSTSNKSIGMENASPKSLTHV